MPFTIFITSPLLLRLKNVTLEGLPALYMHLRPPFLFLQVTVSEILNSGAWDAERACYSRRIV